MILTQTVVNITINITLVSIGTSPTPKKVHLKPDIKYTIGLSATPVREDKMMYVINWFLGEII